MANAPNRGSRMYLWKAEAWGLVRARRHDESTITGIITERSHDTRAVVRSTLD
jgi:hypothetical protein